MYEFIYLSILTIVLTNLTKRFMVSHTIRYYVKLLISYFFMFNKRYWRVKLHVIINQQFFKTLLINFLNFHIGLNRKVPSACAREISLQSSDAFGIDGITPVPGLVTQGKWVQLSCLKPLTSVRFPCLLEFCWLKSIFVLSWIYPLVN